jgi:hypothetical protein
MDTVCALSIVYAAFNVHPQPKIIINSPRMGHATDPGWTKARAVFQGQYDVETTHEVAIDGAAESEARQHLRCSAGIGGRDLCPRARHLQL